MNEELYHHGIKGMKWGVRRTPAQLGHATTKSQSGGEKKATKTPAKKTPGKSVRRTSSISDDELQRRINRLNMEERYEDLVARQKTREKTGVGAWVKEAAVKELKRGGERLLGWVVDKAIDRVTNGKKNKFDIDDFRDKDINDMDAETISKVAKYYGDALKINTARDKLRSIQGPSEQSKDSGAKAKDSSTSSEPPKQSSASSGDSKKTENSSGSESRSKRIPWIYSAAGIQYKKEAKRIARDRRNRDKDVMKWLP